MITHAANQASMVRALAMAGAVVAATAAPMHLESGDVAAGHAFPKAFMARECGGENRSPALAWSDVPKATQSFALVMHDADAPIPGGFYHWVAYNISSGTHRLATAAALPSDQLGTTSAAQTGYFGPCPPPGPAHHYTITVYALDVARIETNAPLSGAELERRIAGHVLARGRLVATASRE